MEERFAFWIVAETFAGRNSFLANPECQKTPSQKKVCPVFHLWLRLKTKAHTTTADVCDEQSVYIESILIKQKHPRAR
jgi:hypothetical protein